MTPPASRPARKSRPRLFVALLLFALVGGASSQAGVARIPPAKYAGVVQTIDPITRTITFRPDQNGKVLRLGWYWETTFLADGKRVKADALKTGTLVRIEYHKPVLGRDYISEIRWGSDADRPAR